MTFKMIRCIFLAAVIANVHSELDSSTGTDLHDKINRLATNNPKSTSENGIGAHLDVRDNAMVIVAAGDTRLLIHRAVLATRSPAMAAELEANSSHITIPDMEGPVLRQLVALLYTPEMPLQPAMSPQLKAAADRFGVPVLRAECWQQAAIPLSVETAAATAVVAIRHSCTSLRQAAISFIKAHMPEVIASQGWADAVYKWHKEVIEVTRMLFDYPADGSTPATGGGLTSPTTQPLSHHTDRDQTPSKAAPSVTSCPSPSFYSVANSTLRNLSAEEMSSMLMEAAKQGEVWEVAALLSAGAGMGARDEDRWTALHWAARQGHVEVVRCLLGAGADVWARNRWQNTPLHLAASWGRTGVVRLLLAASAGPDARDVSGYTPLHYAAAGGHAEAAAALLEAGADRVATTNEGKTAWDLAHNQQILDMLS